MSEAQITLDKRSERRAFYKMVFFLALPIVGQNLIDALVTSTDVIILGFVSQQALSAVSLAAQVQFILFMVLFGLAAGASMLGAQYFGKGDTRTIEKVLGISLRFALPIGALFSLVTMAVPQLVMRLFTPDEALIAQGAIYLRIVGFGYVCTAFRSVYLSIMRSMQRVKVSMVVHTVSFLLNVGLDIFLIFVLKWDVVGVALTTLLARIVEVIICAIHIAWNKPNFRVRLKDIFAKNTVLRKDFLDCSLPSIGNDIAFGLGFTMYSVIIAHLSSDAVAAYSIIAVARNLGTVLCFGVSAATAIIVGNELGANRFDNARLYAGRFLGLSVYTALAGGAVILALSPLLMQLGDLTDTAREYLQLMLWINAPYVLGPSINTCLICGIFRSGGDSRFGLICDALTYGVFMVPIGLFCAFVLKLPVMWVYFILCLDEFLKMPFILRNYRKGAWVRNITRDQI